MGASCLHWVDQEHLLQHCFYSPFMFNTVHRAFGLVKSWDRMVEPSRLLLQLKSAQGLVLWAGFRASGG